RTIRTLRTVRTSLCPEGPFCPLCPYCPLDIEPEVRDVAVLHDVLLAFEAEEAGVAAGGEGLQADEVVAGDDLGADEAALDVGMDGAGGVSGTAAATDRPGAHLVLADGEEGDDA